MKFKIHDLVILRNINHAKGFGVLEGVTKGKSYRIIDADFKFVRIVNDMGDTVSLFPERFEPDFRDKTKLAELL